MITIADMRASGGFRAFRDEELELLLTVAPERRFAAGADLCRQGERGLSCFFLVEGEVEVLTATARGEHRLARLQAGNIAGQMALVNHAARSATLRALTPVVAVEFDRETFERLLTAASPLAVRFQIQVAVGCIRQLRGATARLGELVASAGSLPPRASQLLGIQSTLHTPEAPYDAIDIVEVMPEDRVLTTHHDDD